MEDFENQPIAENSQETEENTAQSTVDVISAEETEMQASKETACAEEKPTYKSIVFEDVPQAEEKEKTPLEPYEYTNIPADKKAGSKATKIFAVVLAAIILLTGACSVGYFYGKKSINLSGSSHTEAELAQKPKKTDEMTEAQVYEKVNKSVVGIRIYNSKGSYVDASGVVYSKEGYIVSNDHVYAEISGAKFKVYTYDGKEYDAEFIAGDKVSDISVFKINASGLEPAQFGDSTKLFSGEHVVAIGRPCDATDDSAITKGVVSMTKRRVKNQSSYATGYIETDAAINPGSSGGALSNMYGQVVGITTSKLSGTEYDSIGYALPSAMMKRVVEDMIENGKVTKRAKLGITYTEITSVFLASGNYSTVGLLIASVSNDSDLYGKVSEGDTITKVNGIEITTDDVILNVIEDSYAGDYITVTVVSKNGTSKDYKIKLSANEGESSYDPIEKDDSRTEENPIESGEEGEMPNGGTFDFPFN